MDRVGRVKDRQVNARFLAMTNHSVFEPQFCNPASGWVEPCRHWFETAGEGARSRRMFEARTATPLAPGTEISGSWRLGRWLEQRCLELWREIPHGVLPETIADVWADEQQP